ncbi:hypothetical protein [Micromonospora sp. IBHARD004]
MRTGTLVSDPTVVSVSLAADLRRRPVVRTAGRALSSGRHRKD